MALGPGINPTLDLTISVCDFPADLQRVHESVLILGILDLAQGNTLIIGRWQYLVARTKQSGPQGRTKLES